MSANRYFREPIPEIYDAARYLDAAVSAHLAGHAQLADELFTLANNKEIWNWVDSIWGKKSTYVNVNKIPFLHTQPQPQSPGTRNTYGKLKAAPLGPAPSWSIWHKYKPSYRHTLKLVYQGLALGLVLFNNG